MANYCTRAFVLKTHPAGEADQLVTLFSHEHGKFRAIAKGGRRPSSSFAGRLIPLSYNEWLLGKGRTWDIVSQVEIVESFQPVRDSYECVTLALSFVSLLDSTLTMGAASPDLFDLFLDSLRTLQHGVPSPAVRSRFALGFLQAEGVCPVLDRCVLCRRSVPPHVERVRFSFDQKGIICSQCVSTVKDVLELSLPSLSLLQQWQSGGAEAPVPDPALLLSVDRLLAPLIMIHMGEQQPLYG